MDIQILDFDCSRIKTIYIYEIVKEIFSKDCKEFNYVCDVIRENVEKKLGERDWSVIEMPFSVYSISYNQMVKIKVDKFIYVIFSLNKEKSNIFNCFF